MIICPNLSCLGKVVTMLFFIFQIMLIISCCLLFKQMYNVKVYLIMFLHCNQLFTTSANQGKELNKFYTSVGSIVDVAFISEAEGHGFDP